jgi:RimJ/RimL family protein N-acetyltransferase
VTPALAGHGFSLRRATEADVEFLVELTSHDAVEPFMAAVSARGHDELLAEIRRSEDDPQHHGRFVVEVEGERAGALAFSVANRRSRIADLHTIMLHPDHRGRGLGVEATRLLVRHLVFDLGYHRVQLEVYGFNERALGLFERAGFVREGVRRRAYDRHGDWVDGVLFGLVREDLEGG